jgi:hypothetical protein
MFDRLIYPPPFLATFDTLVGDLFWRTRDGFFGAITSCILFRHAKSYRRSPVPATTDTCQPRGGGRVSLTEYSAFFSANLPAPLRGFCLAHRALAAPANLARVATTTFRVRTRERPVGSLRPIREANRFSSDSICRRMARASRRALSDRSIRSHIAGGRRDGNKTLIVENVGPRAGYGN